MKKTTIKNKLVSIIMLTCITALLLAGSAFIAWEWTALRHAMAQNLSTQAAMIADNCKAALAFDDAEDAKATISALKAEPSIVFGGVYTKDGKFFAGYYRYGVDSNFRPSEAQECGYSYSNGLLTVFENIILDGEVIGIVCLRSDLHPLHVMLKRNIKIIVAVLVFASLVALLVSSRLQRIISSPILSLAEVAKAVSEKKDYSTRALKQSDDEVGLLIDAFNEMLEQIQYRDFELVQAKEQLEVRVEQRTAELTTTNEQLTTEVAEHEKSEKRKAELLDELEKTNKELKDFAYIVSHDLKAPLRGIKTLANWISTDYADKLDEDGKEQIALISSRVDRMHNLIDGILQYSRIGHVKEKMFQVNLNELVPDIIDMLAPPESITITVEDELPVIECEKTRISQVFQNLISNAIKYMDKPQGQIRTGCMEENGFWTFSITDNGPGIEEKYFEKIFQMFQTLSPRDEFESTGVGLTLVKKIVEMYGGRIWVESKVGEGSTFFFTLSKQKVGGKNEKPEANIVSRR